jgi:hypothetical protein
VVGSKKSYFERVTMMLAMTLLLLATPVGAKSSVASPLERLRAKTRVDAVTEVAPAQLTGQYTSTPKELQKRVGPFLSGNDLYLFPDGTYIYCEWTDIEPVTVYDKGTWAFKNGEVALTSDPEITWKPRAERAYVAVHRWSRTAEILLVGTGRDLDYFEKHAGNDPEFMLLVSAKKREKTFSQQEAEKLKVTLMKDAWRPKYFEH